MVEALFVVAILVVLGSVVIMAIVNHMRSMEKTENDGYAKTLFIVAQNNLTMAEHEGYLGRTNFGYTDKRETGVYYFRVDDKETGFDADQSVLDLMLPFGALDETVRSGCYVIRYQKSSAKVLDVFYWKTTGRYAFNYQQDDVYALLDAYDADPDSLRNYNGSVIGYYGGADAEQEPGARIESPQLQVFNEERLYVRFTRTISGPNEKINLAVRGESSGVLKQMMLLEDSSLYDESKGYYEVVLDDITLGQKHFNEINTLNEDGWKGEGSLRPGENITIYAVAYNNAEYTNVAYSAEQKTNSLFAEAITAEGGQQTVYITNIRHLENLDPEISGISLGDSSELNAVQSSDLSWNDFAAAIAPSSTNPSKSVLVVKLNNGSSNVFNYGFEPINPSYALNYDGQNHTISDVVINATRDDNGAAAGLFGSPSGKMTISNLRLLDFSITGKLSSGTLAGSLTNCQVKNVLACQSKDLPAQSNIGVFANEGNAGGLIGSMSNTNLSGCAAAVYVTSRDSDAGGLVGKTKAGTISGCYSAGFTEGGDYYKPSEDDANVSVPIYSVTAAKNAGGLVGSSTETVIDSSYSTSSAYGTDAAGGLVGSAKLGKIRNCYSAGLVAGGNSGAFAAYFEELTCENNHYFSIINFGMGAYVTSTNTTLGDLIAFDQSTDKYRDFVSTGAAGNEHEQRAPASPYDDTLVAYYQGSFNLKTVKQLLVDNDSGTDEFQFVDTHYGDWPAPEILIVNVPTGSTSSSGTP